MTPTVDWKVLFQVGVQEIRDNGVRARGVLMEVEVVRGIRV